MRGVIFGAAQSGLFRRDCHEQCRSARFVIKRGPGARHFDQDAAAGGVVHGAVVNGVAVDGRADTQMIPMRGEDHGLRLQLGIAARHHRDHVARLDLADLGRDVGVNVDAERNGPEVARVGGLQHFIDGLAREREQLLARVLGDPSGEGQRRVAGFELQLRIFLAPGTAHDVVAVAGGRRGVDDDDGLGAHARGFFVLVGPAAVVGERFAAEEFRIVRRRLVGEQHQHLALHVDAFEIVPMEFWRDNAVADEDRFGVELLALLLRSLTPTKSSSHRKETLLSGAFGREGRAGLGRRRRPSARLEVGAVFAGRFGSGERELRWRCTRWPGRRRACRRRGPPEDRSTET